jgi:hypothetical protein
VGLGLVALALSVASISTCNFISLASGDNQDLGQGFGIFKSTYVNGQCQRYTDRAGGAHAMAKAFGLLAVLSIGSAVLSALAAILLLQNKKRATFAWHTARALFAAGLYSVLSTFFLYGSLLKKNLCVDGTECKAGPGAIITAVNSVLVAVLAILAMLTATPQSPLLGAGNKSQNTKNKQMDPVADEENAFGNEDAVAVSSSNKTRGGGGGWFGSKGSKVAAGTAAVAGGAAAATAAAAVVSTKKTNNTKKTRSSKKVATTEDVVEKKEESWFGSNENVAEPVVQKSQRSLFGKKSKSQSAKDVVVVSEDVVAAAPSSASEKRGWFGSSKGNVTVAAAAAGGGLAAATVVDAADCRSQRSLFGSKKSNQQPPLQNVTTDSAAAAAATELPTRSGFIGKFRSKAKTPLDATTAVAVDEPIVKIVSTKNAETRRALFGSDSEAAVVTGPEAVAAQKASKRAAAAAGKTKQEETVTVVNESVASSCPPCYCMP